MSRASSPLCHSSYIEAVRDVSREAFGGGERKLTVDLDGHR